MKKTYQTPEALLTKVELQQIMGAVSMTPENADPLGEVLSRDVYITRQRNLWDDDEDLEEDE